MTGNKLPPRTAHAVSRTAGSHVPETPEKLDDEIEELLEPPPSADTGRPSSYTKEAAREIVFRVSCGETLLDICRDEHMPDVWAVWYWERRSPAFANAIDLARARQGEAWGEMAIGEALAPPGDKEFEMRRRTASDVLLKAAGRRDPARWGEKPQPGAGVALQIVTNLDMGQGDGGTLTVEAKDAEQPDSPKSPPNRSE